MKDLSEKEFRMRKYFQERYLNYFSEQQYNTTAEKEEVGMKVISKQGSSSCDDLEDFKQFNRVEYTGL